MPEIDPDTYVNWLRSEKVGDWPMWESKCGIIIERPNGEYWGSHGKTKLKNTIFKWLVTHIQHFRLLRNVSNQNILNYIPKKTYRLIK